MELAQKIEISIGLSACIGFLIYKYMKIEYFSENRKGWKTVTSVLAARHKLFGIGGWNYLLLFGLLFGSLGSAGQGFSAINELYDSNIPKSINDRILIFLLSGVILYYFCGICLINKSKLFRPLFISTIIYAQLVRTTYTYLLFYGGSADIDEFLLVVFIQSLISGAWILYAIRSKRLAVTQAHQVVYDDPMLGQVAAKDNQPAPLSMPSRGSHTTPDIKSGHADINPWSVRRQRSWNRLRYFHKGVFWLIVTDQE